MIALERLYLNNANEPIRKMRQYGLLYIILCIAFFKGSLIAQSTYRIKQFTLKDGLSQVTINDLQVDKSGFLWIATQDGLDRFDGQVFQAFKNNKIDSLSLINNKPLCTALDGNNRVWIGFHNPILM